MVEGPQMEAPQIARAPRRAASAPQLKAPPSLDALRLARAVEPPPGARPGSVAGESTGRPVGGLLAAMGRRQARGAARGAPRSPPALLQQAAVDPPAGVGSRLRGAARAGGPPERRAEAASARVRARAGSEV